MASSRVKAVLGAILACGLCVYAVAYADLWLRARSAYLEGEKHLEWARRPELKAAALDRLLAEKEGRLRAEFSAGRIDEAELKQRLELARFERDEAFRESSLKYACVWFRTVGELFSPPESRWVVLARAKLPLAKGLWKRELEAKKIPYQDYMLE
ncbi:MAG: hypothetical protein PHF00_09125 [Elusimicrobia bacterium]|nr:hypothetical protein [Elusimicrobiota bacterium]